MFVGLLKLSLKPAILFFAVLLYANSACAGGVQAPGVVGGSGIGFVSPNAEYQQVLAKIEKERRLELTQIWMDFSLEVSINVATAVLTPEMFIVNWVIKKGLEESGTMPELSGQPTAIVRVDQGIRIITMSVPLDTEAKAVLKSLGYLIRAEPAQ